MPRPLPRHNSSHRTRALLLAATALLPVADVRAVTRTYVGPHNGQFAGVGADANWSPTGVPLTGDDAVITSPLPFLGGFTVIMSDATAELGTLTLDGAESSPLSFRLQGTLNPFPNLSANTEIVGNTASVTLLHNTGLNSVGTLVLASSVGSSGTYRLSGSPLSTTLVATTAYVGYAGVGSFSQIGGVNDSVNLLLGATPSATAFYSQSGGTNTSTNVSIAAAAGASGIYTLSGGVLLPGTLYVGDHGSATFTQTGGTFGRTSITSPTAQTTSSLVIGFAPGSSGSYSLAPVQSVAYAYTSNSYVGFSGTGSLTQSAGSHVASTAVHVAYAPGSAGSYSLSGTGYLTTPALYVGEGGNGTFNHSAGTVTLAASQGPTPLFLGYNPGSSGTYVLSGAQASLSDTNAYVGYAGNGTFLHSAGTHTVNGALYLGYGPGSTGTYSLSGTATLSLTAFSFSANPSIYVGYGGAATFAHSGGTLALTNSTVSLLIGNNGSTNAVYSLSNSGVLTLGQTVVGNNAPGTFLQSGGFHAPATLTLAGGAPASYSLTGGVLSTYFENLGVGARASFTQSGGTHVTQSLYLGASGPFGASYTLSDGTLSVSSAEYIGASGGSSTFTQTGGTHTIAGSLSFSYSGATSGFTNVYRLAGGSLAVPYVSLYAPNAGIVQTGGTLTTSSLSITSGRFELAGGTLATSYASSIYSPGTFAWTAGTLQLNSLFTLGFSGSFIGNGTTLAPSQTLAYSQPFTIPTPYSLTMAGGSLLSNGTFTGTTGSSPSGGFTNLSTLTGFGTFATRLINAGTMTLTGGPSSFTLPVANSTSRTLTVQDSTASFGTAGTLLNTGTLRLVNSTLTSAAPIVHTLAFTPTMNSTLSVDPTSSITASYLRAGTLSTAGPVKLTGDAANASYLLSLSFSGTGSLDLGNNPLIINYPFTDSTAAAVAQLRQQLTSHQLFSSAADATHVLGYLDQSLLNTSTHFNLPVDGSTLIVQLTTPGDANLDGRINADDYAIVDHSLALPPANTAHWYEGDFDYDGQVTPADYLLLDTSYLSAHPAAATSLLSQRESQFGPDYVSQLLTSIPEPSSPFLLTTGYWLLTTFLPRRHRPRR